MPHLPPLLPQFPHLHAFAFSLLFVYSTVIFLLSLFSFLLKKPKKNYTLFLRRPSSFLLLPTSYDPSNRSIFFVLFLFKNEYGLICVHLQSDCSLLFLIFNPILLLSRVLCYDYVCHFAFPTSNSEARHEMIF